MSPEVEALRLFVVEYFDGNLSRCMELDQLLWEVRLAQRHVPNMLHYEGKVQSVKNDLLADLGL